MICLSGDEILMDESASLGPIDPQINGIPARSIINGFTAVQQTLQKQGPSALPAYLPLIQKYDLHILEICKDAEERGKQVVEQWLQQYMLRNTSDKAETASKIVQFFSDYNTHKSHSRPIMLPDASDVGVNVKPLQDQPDLKTKVWDLYLCIKFLFDGSEQIKIFENSKGVNWGKQFRVQMLSLPFAAPPSQNPGKAGIEEPGFSQ